MKTHINYIVIAMFLMAGCSKNMEQIVLEQPSMFTISAGEGDVFELALKAGDKIGINGKEYPILSNKIVGMYDVPVTEKYFVYYPADMEVTNNTLKYTMPAVQQYSGGMVDRKANPVYGVADNESLKNEVMKLNAVVGGLEVSIPANEDFASVTSIALNARSASDILAGDLVLDIESGAVSWGEHRSNTLNMDGGLNIKEGGEVTFALPPMKFEDGIDVKMYSMKGEATATLNISGQSIESGKVLSATLENVKWISMTDYYGKANAVIVKPGKTSVTVDCTPYYTTSLQYAYENIPQTNQQKFPRSAKMLWNDVGSGFVTNVSLATDRKSFTANLSGQTGNAVVAIYNTEDPNAEDAIILWSFHIWVTDVHEHALPANVHGNTYVVLDRNLGAVSVDPGNALSVGFLYQWGRKDPFVSTQEYGANVDATIYDQTGVIPRPGAAAGTDVTATIQWSVENPMRFIRHSRTSSNTTKPPIWYAYDWLRFSDNSLWGNPEGYTIPAQRTLRKSIYDPSPEGYMVAPRDTWQGAVAGNDKAASVLANASWHPSKGFVVSGQSNGPWWYSLGGWRGRSNGNLGAADGTGYYWYSTVENGNSANGAFMSINKDGVALNGKNSRANACSVRCVKIAN